MAFAILLASGWDPIPALETIRAARPIAGIIYAEDAVQAVHALEERTITNPEEIEARIEEWFLANYIDVSKIIHRIWSNC